MVDFFLHMLSWDVSFHSLIFFVYSVVGFEERSLLVHAMHYTNKQGKKPIIKGAGSTAQWSTDSMAGIGLLA